MNALFYVQKVTKSNELGFKKVHIANIIDAVDNQNKLATLDFINGESEDILMTTLNSIKNISKTHLMLIKRLSCLFNNR